MAEQYIKIEGGLISPDVLEKIIKADIEGQKPEDFGFKRALTEEISSLWNEARSYWSAFRKKLDSLSEESLATTETRNLWVLPLLTILGYDPSYRAKAEETGVGTFSISHRSEDSPDAFPIHIVGWYQDLDKGEKRRRSRSPYALVRDYLNATDHLWGITTNGRKFRIIRATEKLTSPEYIEFDLELIFSQEDFQAFKLFVQLSHRSRFPKDIGSSKDCFLEKYYDESFQQNARLRDRLRDRVEKALKALGNGFLSHPGNEHLLKAIGEGKIQPSDFYRDLLMIIYRLLFIMVAEEKDLIQPKDGEKREIYENGYSLMRLRRRISEGTFYVTDNQSDLWEGVKVLFHLLSCRDGEKLGLTVLNGGLFTEGRNIFDSCKLHNKFFKEAFEYLSHFESERGLIQANYAGLDVEELGSVYESLLDYQPVLIHERTK